MNPTPSGIDTVAMADELARMKARKYRFGYYDTDDIRQEIWLSINKSIDKYDETKTKNPKTFFNVVSNNYLKNLVRDTRDVKAANVDRSIESVDNSFTDFTELCELIEYIVVRIEDKLKPALLALINLGGEGVSSYMKSKVRIAVMEILEMYRNE